MIPDDMEKAVYEVIIGGKLPEEQAKSIMGMWVQDMDAVKLVTRRACHAETEYQRGRADGAIEAIRAAAKGLRKRGG